MSSILTIAQAAERMNVSRQRMHQLIDSYQLDTTKVNGRFVVLDEGELDKIPKERKKNSESISGSVTLNSMIQSKIEIDTAQLVEQVSALINAACKQGDNISSISHRSGVARPVVSGIRNKTYASSPSVDNVGKLLKALGFRLTIEPE